MKLLKVKLKVKQWHVLTILKVLYNKIQNHPTPYIIKQCNKTWTHPTPSALYNMCTLPWISSPLLYFLYHIQVFVWSVDYQLILQ